MTGGVSRRKEGQREEPTNKWEEERSPRRSPSPRFPRLMCRRRSSSSSSSSISFDPLAYSPPNCEGERAHQRPDKHAHTHAHAHRNITSKDRPPPSSFSLSVPLPLPLSLPVQLYLLPGQQRTNKRTKGGEGRGERNRWRSQERKWALLFVHTKEKKAHRRHRDCQRVSHPSKLFPPLPPSTLYLRTLDRRARFAAWDDFAMAMELPSARDPPPERFAVVLPPTAPLVRGRGDDTDDGGAT